MSLPVVIAIFGKAASGKDTFARDLAENLGDAAHLVISTTTRPKRECEVEGREYHFIDEDTFKQQRYSGHFIEWNEFRGWYYGIEKSEIVADKANIAVVDFHGLVALACSYDVIPIYMKAPLFVRLKRYVKRDGKFSLEVLRRWAADTIDFLGVKEFARQFETFLQVDSTICTLPAIQSIQYMVSYRLEKSKSCGSNLN